MQILSLLLSEDNGFHLKCQFDSRLGEVIIGLLFRFIKLCCCTKLCEKQDSNCRDFFVCVFLFFFTWGNTGSKLGYSLFFFLFSLSFTIIEHSIWHVHCNLSSPGIIHQNIVVAANWMELVYLWKNTAPFCGTEISILSLFISVVSLTGIVVRNVLQM